MNVAGSRVFTGTLANVGTSYVTLNVDQPFNPPKAGYIKGVVAEVLAGPGTAIALTIQDIPVSGQDLVYDDPDTPGDPITAPWSFSDTSVYFEGMLTGIPVGVKTDDGTNSTIVKVSLVVEFLS